MGSQLYRYAFLLFLIGVLSQDLAQIKFDPNPGCVGESMTLTCDYGSNLRLSRVTVEAFNGSVSAGLLYCQGTPINTTGVGVFSGKTFTGCPTIPAGATMVSVTLTATLELALSYNCTVRVGNGTNVYSKSSGSVQPTISVPPCITTTQPRSSTIVTSGTASGNVQDLNTTGAPPVICTNTSSAILDCASYVTEFPSIRYAWEVPPEANVTSNSNSSSPSFAVLQGQSGLFNCTASSSNSANSVVVVFRVLSLCNTSAPPPPDNSLTIGLAVGIPVAVAVIAIVVALVCLYPRLRLSHRLLQPSAAATLAEPVPSQEPHHNAIRPAT